MKKYIFGLVTALIFASSAHGAAAATAKTKPAPIVKTSTKVAAKNQATPPPGYMALIKKAQQEYLTASKKAKAIKSKKALQAAEAAYAAALEKAGEMIDS